VHIGGGEGIQGLLGPHNGGGFPSAKAKVEHAPTSRVRAKMRRIDNFSIKTPCVEERQKSMNEEITAPSTESVVCRTEVCRGRDYWARTAEADSHPPRPRLNMPPQAT